MSEQKWKLGVDLSEHDSLLDGMPLSELITTVRCNYSDITPSAVRKALKDALEPRLQDMYFIMENNMDEIILAAKEGRNGYGK